MGRKSSSWIICYLWFQQGKVQDVLTKFLFLLYYFMSEVGWWVHTCHGEHAEVPGQLLRVGFLFQTCDPRAHTQIIRLACSCLYHLSRAAGLCVQTLASFHFT